MFGAVARARALEVPSTTQMDLVKLQRAVNTAAIRAAKKSPERHTQGLGSLTPAAEADDNHGQ